MKRRRNIWIVCAALVFVTLGALVATYRPEPYDFLRGASLERGASVSLGTEPERTKRAYATSGTLEAVVASAKDELTAEKGWMWNEPAEMDPPVCRNDTAETWIAFYHSDDVPLDGPRRTVVIVVRPTRMGDGFFTWIAGL